MFRKAKLFMWFVKESRTFTGMSYPKMLFKEHLIKKGKSFVRQTLYHEKLAKMFGSEYAYICTNKIMEVEI